MKGDISPEEARKLLKEHYGIEVPQRSTMQRINEFLEPPEALNQFFYGLPTSIAAIGDLPAAGANIGAWAKETYQGVPEEERSPSFPYVFSEGARKLTNKLVGEPETEAGKIGRAIGEFGNPATLVSNVGKLGAAGLSKLLKISPEKAAQFQKAGVTPTLGEISEGKILPMAQKVLENFPGGAGRFDKAIMNREQQLTDLFNKIGDVDKSLKISETGKLTQKGGKAYNAKATEVASKLYDRAWKGINPADNVPMEKTSKIIDDYFTTITPQARDILEKSTGGKKLAELNNTIKAHEGSLPFGDLKKVYLSDIDDLVNTFGQVGPKEQGKLKQVVGSIRQEMKDFTLKNNPKAAKDYAQADKFWKQYTERTQEIANRAATESDPTKIFNENLAKLKKGDIQPTKVIIQRLSPEEQRLYSSTALNEVGSGRNGIFDANIFGREFNKLRPEAQETLLSGFAKEEATKIKDVSKALEHARIASNAGNTSKTAYYTALTGWLTSLVHQPVVTLGSAAGARIGAELFTNPKVLDAFSKASKARTADGVNRIMYKYLPEITKEITRMSVIASEQSPKEITPEEARQLLGQFE